MIDDYVWISLFEDHETVHLVIVNSSATVTPVAHSVPSISGANYILTEANMDEDSISLSECLNEEKNLKFGSLEPSRFEIDIFNDTSLASLKDEEIAVYIYFDENSATLFQVGVYTVKMDEYSDDRSTRHITAFDVLQDLYDYDITKLYNALYKTATTVSIKDIRDAVFEWLTTPSSGTTSLGIKGAGYDYTLIQEEVDLVNDDFEVEKSIESDVVTFGFLMSGLLEANGVFGHIDRNGVFRYIALETYDQDPKRLITEGKSYKPVIYEDYHVWGIGYVAIWNKDNIRIAYEGSSSYSHPSVYNIVDSFVFSNNAGTDTRIEAIKEAALNLRNMITHMWYYPIESECYGNLCYEVGDRINLENVTYDEENDNTPDYIPTIKELYSYILKRECKGLQEFVDTYIATGDRKQPRYKITNDNWHEGDSGGSGSVDTDDGTGEVVDDSATRFIKYCRNIGIRLLQEPSVNLEYVRSAGTHQVEITWIDPSDITNYKPVPCAWAGTIVVRSESKPPVHPWDDCEILVTSTTRDEYSETPFVDDTIEENKKYYYGIFPYHIALDDNDHPIKYYRFTKVLSVNTQKLLMSPLISAHSVSGTTVALTISIPELEDGTYSYIKVVAKKGSIPASKTDGVVKDVNASATSVTFDGLDDNSHYYFVIFTSDGTTEVASDPDDCMTGVDEGYNFAYTGSIQTFTAPKTGIYQLETWGAQGGNAEDSENELTARGGYGAYAKGEVLLVQGETLYIGVGGQNGFNGGGLKIWDGSEIAIIWSGENNKLTAQINNNTILFKMYSGNTVIYSFTSQTGTSVSDISKINAGFLIDTEQEVAKPSFIYDIGSSSYKYNSETPTDAEMADIYTWLQAGL